MVASSISVIAGLAAVACSVNLLSVCGNSGSCFVYVFVAYIGSCAFVACGIYPAEFSATAVDVKFPMLISIFSVWMFRFGEVYLLAELLGMGAVGIWISMSMMDWSFRAVIYCCRWRELSKEERGNEETVFVGFGSIGYRLRMYGTVPRLWRGAGEK